MQPRFIFSRANEAGQAPFFFQKQASLILLAKKKNITQ